MELGSRVEFTWLLQRRLLLQWTLMRHLRLLLQVWRVGDGGRIGCWSRRSGFGLGSFGMRFFLGGRFVLGSFVSGAWVKDEWSIVVSWDGGFALV